MTQDWFKIIEVFVTVGQFRIGSSGGGSGKVDLPVATGLQIGRHHGHSTSTKTDISWNTVNLSSTFRGVLRFACRKLLSSIPRLQSINAAEESLFGSPPPHENPGARTREGKIKIANGSITTSQATYSSRTSIEIEPIFGSVKEKALFSYEYLRPENYEGIQIPFRIEPVLPLDKSELALLYGTLLFTKTCGFGGFKSTGFGNIKSIGFKDPQFVQVAKKNLARYLHIECEEDE